MNSCIRELYDCFCKTQHSKELESEIENCHKCLIDSLGKDERKLVLRIIDAKDHIAEDISIESFVCGFTLACRLACELKQYQEQASLKEVCG